jgi:nickel/cobalt transporter (NicO) family protein
MSGAWGWLDHVLLGIIDRPAAAVSLHVVTLLIAAGVGAAHALGPGHGKALVGAYLAGAHGRARDAVGLGAVVALMHTGSVLVLGLVLHRTQRLPFGDDLVPVLGVVTGFAVAALGGSMLWRQHTRGRRTPATVAAGSDPGARAHHHPHHHPMPAGVSPISRVGIAALATTGGLLPSPSAFLVLATALAMGRAGYGLALVGAFSVGMALTLTLVGLVALSGRRVLDRQAGRRPPLGRLGPVLPTLSAAGVVLGGAVIAGSALRTWLVV